MTLTLEDKKAIVSDVSEVASTAISAVVAEYMGLTVEEMTNLRKEARNAGVYLRVVRNTLAKRAVSGTSFECMTDVFKGPVILAFSKDEPSASARLVRDFSKNHDKLKVMGLAIDGQFLTANQIDAVATLPTRDEGIAQLMGMLQAPITQFVRTVAAPTAKFVQTLAAVAEQKKQAG